MLGSERRRQLVFGLGAGQRVQRAAGTGATLLHQLAVQRLGRGIRREVELAAQDRAAELVLAERLRVASRAREARHQLAMRAFLQRLDREQPVEGVDLAVDVAGFAAQGGELGGGRRQLAAQAATLCGQPFVEGARAGVEAIEQRVRAERARGLQRGDAALGQQAAQRANVHFHLREIERDLLRVGFDAALQARGQRAPQRRQRLAQARAGEFGVGFFPEQRGESLAALPRAVLQREEREQGAALARRYLEGPVTRAPELEATEQSQPQHPGEPLKGTVTSRGDCPV